MVNVLFIVVAIVLIVGFIPIIVQGTFRRPISVSELVTLPRLFRGTSILNMCLWFKVLVYSVVIIESLPLLETFNIVGSLGLPLVN